MKCRIHHCAFGVNKKTRSKRTIIVRVATFREKSRKNNNFQGQEKVKEFCKKSGKILEVIKVSEKSGNFILQFTSFLENYAKLKKILMANKRS